MKGRSRSVSLADVKTANKNRSIYVCNKNLDLPVDPSFHLSWLLGEELDPIVVWMPTMCRGPCADEVLPVDENDDSD